MDNIFCIHQQQEIHLTEKQSKKGVKRSQEEEDINPHIESNPPNMRRTNSHHLSALRGIYRAQRVET